MYRVLVLPQRQLGGTCRTARISRFSRRIVSSRTSSGQFQSVSWAIVSNLERAARKGSAFLVTRGRTGGFTAIPQCSSDGAASLHLLLSLVSCSRYELRTNSRIL